MSWSWWKWPCGLLLVSSSLQALAQNFEESHAEATQIASASLFQFNPAVPQGRASRMGFGVVLPRKVDRSGYVLGAAFSFAGSDQSSYGIRGEATSFEPNADDLEDRGETFKGTYVAAHYGVLMAGILRMGLIAQFYKIEGDQVTFGDGVTSDSSGTLIGVGAGLHLGSEKGGLGIAYYPGMRGAVEAEGEHRILGRSQTAVVEVAFPFTAKTTLGLTMRTAQTPEDIDSDVSLLDSPSGARSSGTAAAGYTMRHDDRWLTKLTIQREGYDAASSPNDKQRRATGEDAEQFATRLKFFVGKDSQPGCESYLGISSWLRERAVDEDEGAGLPGDYSLSQITYLGMLAFGI